MTAFHQVLPVLSRGDAIGSAVLRTQGMLREMGFESEVFAGLMDPSFRRLAHDARSLASFLRPTDVVMYHLSIGSPLARTVKHTRARVVLVYHNITPAEYFFESNPRVAFLLKRGRDDLTDLAGRAELVIADSSYNAAETRVAGARHVAVVPPPLDLGRLRPVASYPNPQQPGVVFVGRLAPNKGHAILIRALCALRATSLPDAQLVLAGTIEDAGPYFVALQRLASRLGVSDAVTFTGRVGDGDLHHVYASAAAFACASEHEGFCVPLLEAMAFSVPIVAYKAGAVAETLDTGGLLTTTTDPLVWAGLLDRAIHAGPTRDALIAAGRRRLRDFDDRLVAARLRTALESADITPT